MYFLYKNHIFIFNHLVYKVYVFYHLLTFHKYYVTGFDSSNVAEELTINVKYSDFTCKFYISVKEVPKPDPVLVSISVAEMPKTEYKVDERMLDLSGALITKHYNDGTTKNTIILHSYVSGWQEARGNPGTHTLTIKFKENGVIKTTTFEITITE